jgi:hypothetical protein
MAITQSRSRMIRAVGVCAMVSALLLTQGERAKAQGTQAALEQQMGAIAQAQAFKNGGAAGHGIPQGVAVSAPQPIGPKKAGKIRIGVAPVQAQVGQGNNSQSDYGAPIRNSIVLIMNGPAVEIVPLDARMAFQVQAEAKEKECDYILSSSVTVKHQAASGGFGKLMKMAGPAASYVPMMNVGTMLATQAAGMAATAVAQQQATNQLSAFNGQIKSKDDVSMDYQLLPTGGDKAKLQTSLNGKAKSDGEDVLTPLIEQAANTIFIEISKK